MKSTLTLFTDVRKSTPKIGRKFHLGRIHLHLAKDAARTASDETVSVKCV